MRHRCVLQGVMHMHTINAGQRTVGLLALMLMGLLTNKQVSAASKTFYMDEGTHYSDISMCNNHDLNTVTEFPGKHLLGIPAPRNLPRRPAYDGGRAQN